MSQLIEVCVDSTALTALFDLQLGCLGHAEVVKTLIHGGEADVNASNGWTPLQLAAETRACTDDQSIYDIETREFDFAWSEVAVYYLYKSVVV